MPSKQSVHIKHRIAPGCWSACSWNSGDRLAVRRQFCVLGRDLACEAKNSLCLPQVAPSRVLPPIMTASSPSGMARRMRTAERTSSG